MSSHRTPVTELLREVPLLAPLGDESLARLAAGSDLVSLRAGRLLFREGEPADSLFMVCSGSLEAVSAEEGSIRMVKRGGCVGELALLTGSQRSASVHARRDSSLLRISREDFDELMKDSGFAYGLLRSFSDQLRASRGIDVDPAAPPTVIALAALPEIPVRQLAAGLAGRLQEWFGVTVLAHEVGEGGRKKPNGRSTYAERLDQAERDCERVLLVVEDLNSEDDWTTFALEQADQVLIVTDGRGDPPPRPRQGCGLVVYGDEGPLPVANWLDALSPDRTYRVRAKDLEGGIGRLARRLAGRSVGVVLSGGGARGFAHIGAIEAIQDSGLEIDRIGGCSMGALVGALYARGLSAAQVRSACFAEFVERNPMNDYTVPIAGLIRRRKSVAMLRRLFGQQRIEELDNEYFCVSADLVSGRLIVQRRGRLDEAVGASICVPGLSPPVPQGNRLLIDGGILNNLPVETMAEVREGPTIAVDVTARYQPGLQVRARPRLRRLQSRLRLALVGEEQPLPSLRETLFQTIALGSVDTNEAAQRHADLLIEPQVGEYGMNAFHSLDRISGKGYAEAVTCLGRIDLSGGADGSPDDDLQERARLGLT